MAVRMRAWLLGVCIACLLLFVMPVLAETEGLKISLPETVKGYTPCEIVVESPVAGEMELKLFDMTQNLWLVRKEQISEGKNILPWDGLGEYGERMFAGPYLRAAFLGDTVPGQGREMVCGVLRVSRMPGGNGSEER